MECLEETAAETKVEGHGGSPLEWSGGSKDMQFAAIAVEAGVVDGEAVLAV